MRIGDFSACSGVSIDTLRYYEKIGLLKPERRNGKRFYHEMDFKLLQAITKLKQMNFSLEDIRTILDFDKKIDEGLIKGQLPREIIEKGLIMFKAKLREIEEKEKEIKEAKMLLRHIMEKIPDLEKMADEANRKGERIQ